MKNKVNLFLVGAMKAGTTSLTRFFEQHPDIFVCPVKEPNFFMSQLPHSISDGMDNSDIQIFIRDLHVNSKRHFAHIKTMSDYHSLFKFYNNEKYLADCSTCYLHSKDAAVRIKDYNPGAKVIILLRDPVQRAFSHYKLDYGKGRTSQSFKDAWEAIDKQNEEDRWNYYRMSLYADAIDYYQQLFGKKNVCVITMELMSANRKEFFRSLSDFLEIDFSGNEMQHEHKSVKPRYPLLNKFMHKYKIKGLIRETLPSALLENAKQLFYTKENLKLDLSLYNELLQFFADDIKRTEELIGYKLIYLEHVNVQ
ncbi:MAG TPA: sulfotransferase [Chitinophagaceae bacterium]|jgi:hypothetical protein